MYLHFVDRRQDRALAGGGGHNPVHSRGHDIHDHRRARSCSESRGILLALLACGADGRQQRRPAHQRQVLAGMFMHTTELLDLRESLEMNVFEICNGALNGSVGGGGGRRRWLPGCALETQTHSVYTNNRPWPSSKASGHTPKRSERPRRSSRLGTFAPEKARHRKF